MNEELHPEQYGDPVEQATSAPSGLNPEQYGTPLDGPDLIAQQARSNLNAAVGSNPDAAAKAANVSKQLGLPVPAVAQDAELYGHIAMNSINQENVAHNPKLQAWLAKNPWNAQVANDDIPNLTFIEKAIAALDTGARSAFNENQLGRLGNELQAKTLAGAETGGTMAEVAERQKAEQDTPQFHGGFGVAQDLTRLVVSQLDSVVSGLPEAAAGAALGAATTPEILGAGAIPGALTGFGVGWKIDQSRIAAGQAYLQMNQIVGRDGQPLSEAGKLLASAMVGAGTYALFSIGGAKAKGMAEGATAKLSQDAMAEALTRPSVQSILATAGKTMAKGSLMFAAFNGAMTALNSVSTEIAKLASPGEFDSAMNSPEVRAQYVGQIADAMGEGLKMGVFLGGIGAAMGLRGDFRRVREANDNAATLNGLMTGAGDSKLRTRSAQMFNDFMQEQTKGKPSENMYIPAERIEALYQEYAMTPDAHDSLFGFVPNLKEQLAEAKGTNGDVVIPTADFVSHLAGTDIGKKLVPDIRMSPDGLSLNEAKEYQKQAAELQKQYAKATPEELPDEGKQVYEDVLKKATSAGYSEGEAKVYASLYAARYGARGERMGTNAMEEYKRVPLEITRELPEITPEDISRRREVAPVAEEQRAQPWTPEKAAQYRAAAEKLREANAALAQSDQPTVTHEGRVAGSAAILAKKLKLDEEQTVRATLGGYGHDIGKAGMRNILDKQGELTPADWEILNTHPAVSAKIMRGLGLPDNIIRIAAEHHTKGTPEFTSQVIRTADIGDSLIGGENSGHNYPLRFKGKELPRTLDSVLTIMDAMTKEGQLNPEVYSAYRDMLVNGQLPRAQKEQLEINAGGKRVRPLFQSTQAEDEKLYNQALYFAKTSNNLTAPRLAGELRVYEGRAERLLDRMEENGYVERRDGKYEVTDKINVANILYQNQPENRASIRFNDTKTQISLFRDANLSSLAHESAHLWLKELSEDAGREGAPESVKADFDAALKWMGFAGDRAAWNAASIDEQRQYHEKFARAFERYLREGKAPTQALRAVFNKLKDWLQNIYKSAESLGAPINEEIRGVFDRLLATDEQIADARHAVGDRTTFETTGMGKTEAAAYAKAIEQSRAASHDKLLAKAMEDVRKKYSGGEHRAEVADEVAEEIDARPDMQAFKFLRDGEGKSFEPFKLNDDDAQRIAWGAREPADYPVMRQLPVGITSKDGVHPDEAAEMLGFKSGAELVRAMQRLEIQRQAKMIETGRNDSVRQVQIDNEVAARMNAKYPQPTPEEMQAEALDAVHNKERDQVLAIEARVLARMAGKAQIDTADIRGWARDTLEKKTVADAMAVNTYALGERKAANLAAKALLAKKYDEALLYKRQQILNNELYKEASAIRDEVNKAQGLFERLSSKKTLKGMDQEYLDQIHDLLERFGYDSGRGEELQRTKGGTLEEFVNRKSAENGVEIAADHALYTLASKSVKEMTIPEFRALSDAIHSMDELGREEKMITVGGQKVEFDGVVSKLTAAIRALGERAKSDFYDPNDAGKWAAFKEKTFGALRSIDASLLKPEALFDQIDKADPFGIANQAVYRRIKDAQHNEDLWHQKAAGDIKALVKAMPKGWEKSLRKDILSDPKLLNPDTGNPMRLERQRMIAMALNWGNEGNRKKLADGYGWQQADIKAFLDRNMLPEEWNFVQKVWGMFADHTAELDALQKRTTGLGLKLVQADPFDTPHGHMEGGYYPIVYDPNKSDRTAALQEKNTQAMFPGNYTRATTPKGNTIARVEGVKRPIELSLDIAPWKIGQTLHDLAFREAIMDADRLLSNKEVRSAMKDVFGPEYANLLRPWLKYVANSRNIDDAAIGWMDKAVSAARANTVIVGIGFRLTTLFKHTMTALSNSIGELGPHWMLRGTYEFYGSMPHAWDFIKEKSPEMAFRLNSYDKDLTAQYDHLLKDSAYTNFQKNAQYFGHIAISYFDLGSAAPTWLGAYRKGLHDGMSDADAVYFADKTVRNAHGAQGITDTAAIQHATGVARLVNMFYGFFNHIYNRQRTMFIQGKEGMQALAHGEFRTAGKDFAGVLGKSFYYITVPAIVEALATSHGPDENKDEGWGEWAAKAIAAEIPAGIPILRDIAKAAIEGRGYEISPIGKLVDTMIQSGRDISKIAQGEEAPKAGEHAAAAAGYIFGLPTAAPFTAGKFLWDYNNGEVDPQSVNEWINGITKGRTE